MHFSLARTVTSACILAVALPLVNTQGIPRGIYHLENMAFDSLSPKRVLDLDLSPGNGPRPPLIVYPHHAGDNQHWIITSAEWGLGYNIADVAPYRIAFVPTPRVGSGVIGSNSWDNKTTFQFNKISPDIYQVVVASGNETLAMQSTTDGGQVTLGILDGSDPHQAWRLVQLNIPWGPE